MAVWMGFCGVYEKVGKDNLLGDIYGVVRWKVILIERFFLVLCGLMRF